MKTHLDYCTIYTSNPEKYVIYHRIMFNIPDNTETYVAYYKLRSTFFQTNIFIE